MIYLKRILLLLAFIPRSVVAYVCVIVTFPFDLIIIPMVYYIGTGHNYFADYFPLGIAIGKWIIGLGFKWKDKENSPLLPT